MRKYKLGDTVTIRKLDDLINEFGAGLFCDKMLFVSGMHYTCGKPYQIQSVYRNSRGDIRYKIKGTSGYIQYFYNDAMFVGHNKLKTQTQKIRMVFNTQKGIYGKIIPN